MTTKIVSKYFDLGLAQTNSSSDGLVWHGDKQWVTPLWTEKNAVYFYDVGMTRTSFSDQTFFNFDSLFGTNATTTYNMD